MRGSRALLTIPKFESVMFPQGSELRVVEDVEKFDTEIESVVLLDYRPLRHAKIGVVESRPMEEAPVSGAKCPKAQFWTNAPCGHHTWSGFAVEVGCGGMKKHPVLVAVGQSEFALRGFRVTTLPMRFGISVAELPVSE